jgi:hypothetical protein
MCYADMMYKWCHCAQLNRDPLCTIRPVSHQLLSPTSCYTTRRDHDAFLHYVTPSRHSKRTSFSVASRH